MADSCQFSLVDPAGTSHAPLCGCAVRSRALSGSNVVQVETLTHKAMLLLCVLGAVFLTHLNAFSARTPYKKVSNKLTMGGMLDDIDLRLRAKESAAEREIYELMEQGYGPPNHRADIRLFDKPEGYEPEVTLYRDQAAWCPYCEKVWLQLEEKRIPYVIKKVPLRCYGDKPAWFRGVNPSGGLPVATIKGKTLAESNDIMFSLESAYPSHNPLIPTEEDKKALCNDLLRLERRVFGCWFQWLTSYSFPGLNSQEKEMDSLLKEVDTALKISGGPYFLGDYFSIVDVMFTPFLERMSASLPYYKGFESRTPKYPHLLRWYEAMDTREAYRGIKSDYYTHIHDLPPQIGGCQSSGNCKPYQQELDGQAWDTEKEVASLVEPMLPADPQEAARDAVRRTLANFDAVVRFAARGPGKKGSRQMSAALADPYAEPNEDYTGVVGTALMEILSAMLEFSGPAKVPFTPPSSWSGKEKEAVRLSLEYLRERVGVPRDMTVHGARVFRAHINAYIETI